MAESEYTSFHVSTSSGRAFRTNGETANASKAPTKYQRTVATRYSNAQTWRPGFILSQHQDVLLVRPR